MANAFAEACRPHSRRRSGPFRRCVYVAAARLLGDGLSLFRVLGYTRALFLRLELLHCSATFLRPSGRLGSLHGRQAHPSVQRWASIPATFHIQAATGAFTVD